MREAKDLRGHDVDEGSEEIVEVLQLVPQERIQELVVEQVVSLLARSRRESYLTVAKLWSSVPVFRKVDVFLFSLLSCCFVNGTACNGAFPS